ncbi:MAG TPA: VWA domain-containing protein [Candidatus Solibacter sp.]|nr:VWA domain-containing protein [Candidatus Solibacter sp.]
MNLRLGLFVPVLLLCAPQISSRQSHSVDHQGDRIYLDVEVGHKSGPPVKGLQQSDFTILDNDVPQTITSFEAVDGKQAHIEVILVFDAVNIGSPAVANAYEEIKKFLKSDRGRLAYPTAVAIITDTGLETPLQFSQDGNAISATLGKRAIAAPGTSAAARFEISFRAFGQILAAEREKPGRKIILWVSAGWPPLAGLENEHGAKLRQLQQEVFANVVEVSTQLRESQATVFSLDPSALGDLDMGMSLDMSPTTGMPSHVRRSDKNVYVAGAEKASEVGPGDLTLETIATQSGGLVLNPGNDLAAALQKCAADAETYYKISFDPVISDQPNEYHRLEIRVAKLGLTASTREGYYSRPRTAEKFAAESGSGAPSGGSDQSFYANTHPYIDLPLAQLIERIPELKTIQPAPDQQELPLILEKLGRSVDDFASNIGDLIAHEEITQERLNAKGKIKAKERVQDSYLILHHGYAWGASSEYRMDNKGNRLGQIGLDKGYLVTSGYALSSISFSTAVQSQSRFRYLGEEMIGSRDTYVLGFAQKPGEATFLVTMRGTGGADVDVLTQGILWVDKNNFQIIQMRSDLLAPNKEIQLDQLTQEVTFGEVQLKDLPNPLRLPSDVDVFMEIERHKYRNVHHYTNYRRYRVSVKIGDSQ